MYPISDTVKALFRANQRQTAYIVLSGVNGSRIITQDDIPSGGLSVNRYCSSGSQIEIGSAVAAELSLELNNFTHVFDSVVFGGAELYVQIGIKDWLTPNSSTYYVPLGYFTVDKTPKIADTISLNALDRMVLFDKVVAPGTLPVPCTVSALLTYICEVCNVTLGTDIVTAGYANAGYVVKEDPVGDDTTYRQILSWIAEITGTCAFIDWQGQLVLKWYTSSGETIGTDIRYSSEIDTESITITGVQITGKDNFWIAGDAGYVVNIEGNSLIQGNETTVVTNIYSQIGGFTYTPASASIEPSPHLYPLDTYTFVAKNNSTYTAIITDVTFSLNKNTAIQGRGESETTESWARANPLTKRERVILKTLEEQRNAMLNTRFQAMLELNELICNTAGLYQTDVTQSDGSTIFYLHDAPKLEESKTIFTFGANGVAWTDTGWNDGSPVWHYGVTTAGKAFFKLISAEGVNIEKIGEDYHIQITPSAFQIFFKDMLVTEIEEDTMSIPRMIASDYVQIGRVRLAPHGTDGTDLIFVD